MPATAGDFNASAEDGDHDLARAIYGFSRDRRTDVTACSPH
jgi:hypothetical protein